MGCRFYPIIYDLSSRKCILDNECPKVEQIYPKKDDLTPLCQQLIMFLKEELNIAIDNS